MTRVNRPYHDFKYGYVVDFVNIKENFDATNDRYLRELNRTTDDAGAGQNNIANDVMVTMEEVEAKIKQVKGVLFNFTTDNMEEFRKQIDEIDNKDSLYELRNTLSEAKAIVTKFVLSATRRRKRNLILFPQAPFLRLSLR